MVLDVALRHLWRKLARRKPPENEPDMRPTRDKLTQVTKGSYGLPVRPYSEEKPGHDEATRWR
jgi:hypothetical protein